MKHCILKHRLLLANPPDNLVDVLIIVAGWEGEFME